MMGAVKSNKPFPRLQIDELIFDLVNVSDILVENPEEGQYLLDQVLNEAMARRLYELKGYL
jgi:hypothetical protein